MLQARVAVDAQVKVRVAEGFPSALDALASAASGQRSFLRAAWYAAANGVETGRTVLAERADGTPIAAIPTVEMGPSMVGARAVPGSYWPFRSILFAADANEAELAAMFADPALRGALAPLWRVGPVYRDDPVTSMLKTAAARAGWTVLTRPLGRTWHFDLAATLADQGWPRKSTRRRLANYERQLEQTGPVRFRFVTGGDWGERVLNDLATIERNSWVGKTTDGSGAKFLHPRARGLWHKVTRDPVLASALSATILYAGDTPAAFSFDLREGDLQYSIASSYDDRFAAARPGKIVTYRQLGWAGEQGIKQVDLGAGDSGYKREMGAVPGSEIVDLLIVRSRSLAQLLSFKWGAESALGRDAFIAADQRGDLGKLLQPFLAAGAIAVAAMAIAE